MWLPSEFEIAGAPVWGSNKYGAMGFVQYPLFAQNMNRNIGRAYWWLLSAVAGNSSHFVNVNYSGNVNNSNASNDSGGPVCFRIA